MNDRISDSAPAGEQLFISYNSRDREAVATVRGRLRELGVSSFLDHEHLIKGLPWPEALEQALARVSAVAVFIGSRDFGVWQKKEMGFALDRQTRDEQVGRTFPVIPVLLPDSDPTPGFLFLNTWVDLRQDLLDPRELDGIVRAIGGEVRRRPPETGLDLPPYRGLQLFRERDAAFFCGREAFTKRLLEAVLSRDLVAVVGPSGSGKSSVVQAGLLPALRKQRPPAASWDAVIFRPGDRPYQGLADALIPLLETDLSNIDRVIEATKLGKALASGDAYLESVVDRLLEKSEGTDRLLLVADQFEEFFTLTPDVDRRPFVERLLQALERTRLTVVVSLRTDFYGHALGLSRSFSDRIEQGLVNLGPMTRDELERSIREPATRVGLKFETGLETKILDDLADQPGNLPLLEFALTELWERRKGVQMTHAAYDNIGGVTGALAKRAEFEYAKHAPDQQPMRRLFTRLVRVAGAEEGSQDTRRRAEISELEPGAKAIVQRLTAARLLVTSGSDTAVEVGEVQPPEAALPDEQQAEPHAARRTTVEVAHEALIQGWDRLRGWLNEDREFLLWRQRLQSMLDELEHTGRDEGALLRGAPLVEAKVWLDKRSSDLAPAEQDFIRQSIALRDREQAARDRLRRRIKFGLAIGLLIALLLGSLAVVQWRIAADRAQVALSRQLAAQAVRYGIDRPDLGLLVGVEAIKVSPTDEAKSSLQDVMRHNRHLITYLRGHRGGVHAVAFSPDGKTLVSGGRDGKILIWNIESMKSEGRLLTDHHEGVTEFAFSTDGNILVSAGRWDTSIVLWDAKARKMIGTLNAGKRVSGLALSPDGELLISARDQGGGGTLWNLATREASGQLPNWGGASNRSISLSPDGKILAATFRTGAILWDVQNRQTLRSWGGLEGTTYSVDFSPKGDVLAGSSQEIHLWRMPAAERIGEPLVVNGGLSLDIGFSPDGKTLASSHTDGPIRLWDVATGHSLGPPLAGHSKAVDSLAFSPNSRYLASAGSDGTVILWGMSGRKVPWLAGDPAYALALSADGKTLAVAGCAELGRAKTCETSEIRLWYLPDLSLSARLVGVHTAKIINLAWDARNRLLVSGDTSGHLVVWNPVARRPLAGPIDAHPGWVAGLAFSEDGRRLVSAGTRGTIRLWNMERFQSADSDQPLDLGKPASGRFGIVAFSPDGRTLAWAGGGDKAELWNFQDGRTLGPPLAGHSGRISSLAFSPKGDRLATVGEDGTLRLWDTTTHQTQGDPIGDLPDSVRQLVFSPDGRILALGVGKKILLLRNLPSSSPARTVLEGHESRIEGLAFTPNGQTLVSASYDGAILTWDANTGVLVGELRGYTKWVNGVAFGPAGEREFSTRDLSDSDFWVEDTERPRDRIPDDLGSLQRRACRIANRGLTKAEWDEHLPGKPYRPICRPTDP